MICDVCFTDSWGQCIDNRAAIAAVKEIDQQE